MRMGKYQCPMCKQIVLKKDLTDDDINLIVVNQLYCPDCEKKRCLKEEMDDFLDWSDVPDVC